MPPRNFIRDYEIKRRVETGEFYREIAEDFGISPQRVQKIAKRMGAITNSKKLLIDDRKKVWSIWFLQGWSISEIAAKEGITPSSVHSFCKRNNIEIPKKKLQKETHGNRSRYRNGCRCEECRKSNREYMATLKNSPTPSHGYSGYKNYGCRCDVCKAAGSENNRRTRERRLARLKEK